ncbi:uncharacterized protein MEPE_04354 [Melanopsichium pennsylvanicum]|uniref:Uncharacterized protein n=1 Tax=Melanopsichium pennsylvanicum TaxID=63383 RepID=A0AAJ4XNP5_9BASI|nr:uncharacterized protein MEPE_04354 [Melanopsichium pennsylvanicum]
MTPRSPPSETAAEEVSKPSVPPNETRDYLEEHSSTSLVCRKNRKNKRYLPKICLQARHNPFGRVKRRCDAVNSAERGLILAGSMQGCYASSWQGVFFPAVDHKANTV